MVLPAYCAFVVVLYHSDPHAHELRLSSIVERGYTAILVDNTPIDAAICATPLYTTTNLYHVLLGENTGIANALNVGIQLAFDLSKHYVFTFDQDSEISIDLLERLLKQYVEQEAQSSAPLVLGPHPINKVTGASYLRRRDRLRRFFRNGAREPYLLRVNEIISSGLLANRDTYDKVGLYDTELFIDFVDHEWCWRLREMGGACLVDLSTPLSHMVGSGDIPFTLGMKFASAHRLYYLFRNGIYLILALKMPFFDATKFLVLVPFKLLLFAFFRDRKARWKYAVRGLLDGLRLALSSKSKQSV